MYIIRHEVAEYHPSENEYISLSGEYLIITEFQDTLKRDDIQPKGLMISTTLRAVMIYHYSVMDKKSRIKMIRLFWRRGRDSILARTARSVFLGRGRPPEVRSVPIPLRIPPNTKKKP